eukprot:4871588-Pyramimonas_sp.AAC.1
MRPDAARRSPTQPDHLVGQTSITAAITSVAERACLVWHASHSWIPVLRGRGGPELERAGALCARLQAAPAEEGALLESIALC